MDQALAARAESVLESALLAAREFLGDAAARSVCNKFTADVETQVTVTQQLGEGALVCSSFAHETVFVPAAVAATLSSREQCEGSSLHVKAVRTTSGKSDLRATEANSGDNGWRSFRSARQRGARRELTSRGR